MERPDTTQLVLDAIRIYWEQNGFSPSIKDLLEMVNVSSTSVIVYHLDKLEKAEYIKRVPGVARSITLITKV